MKGGKQPPVSLFIWVECFYKIVCIKYCFTDEERGNVEFDVLAFLRLFSVHLRVSFYQMVFYFFFWLYDLKGTSNNQCLAKVMAALYIKVMAALYIKA